MKYITELKGVEFLVQINKARHAISELLEKTNVVKIYTTKPELTGNETEEEKQEKLVLQAKINLNNALDKLLDEQPEATYNALKMFCVSDTEPDGMDLIGAALSIISDERVINFLLQLMNVAKAL